MIQVQPYQARLPMHGSGGVTSTRLGMQDLRQRPGPNPIVEALKQILDRKRQAEQDALEKQIAESQIGLRGAQAEALGQPKSVSGRVVTGGGKTWLINPQTGEKRDLGIPAPKGKVADRNITDIINDIANISNVAEPLPEDILGQPIRDAAITPLLQELMGKLSLEEYEKEPGTPREPRKKRYGKLTGWDWTKKDIPAIPAVPPTMGIRKKKTPIIEALAETKKVESREIKEPATIEEFVAEVERLKKIDMKAARAYYDRWAKKWQ